MQSLTTSLQNSRTSVLSTDERVRTLQRKLYLKAKQDKAFKFYVLYDKVRLDYFLWEAYRRVRANGGAPGVDRTDFEQIEKAGLPEFIEGIRKDLLNKTYKAQAVRRVYIPKANGKLRPLGIPTIRDRVVQMSCKMVIEPVFEADFGEDSYGFRPKKSARDAMTKIKNYLKEKRTHVLDADLEAYFDTIPHDKLMIAVKQRIADNNVLALILQWLKCPVIDSENRTSGGKHSQQGTPQGGVISPLLSNIYLNLLDRIITNPHSEFARAGIRIVRYADDFILLGGHISDAISNQLEGILTRMGLRLNKEKTSRKQLWKEPMDFLGFTIRWARTPYKGSVNRFWNIHPSVKSEKKLRQSIREIVRTGLHSKPGTYVYKLNVKLRGWINYYKINGVTQLYTSISRMAGYLGQTIYRMYRRKSQNGWSRRYRQCAYKKFIAEYGLINLYECINRKAL
jgi:RNA-directed DNA polymerase